MLLLLLLALLPPPPQVCWRSAKVQLNSGVLERRLQNWDAAERHFRCSSAATVHHIVFLLLLLHTCMHLTSSSSHVHAFAAVFAYAPPRPTSPTNQPTDRPHVARTRPLPALPARLAKELDPSYCEPDFHLGVTLVNKAQE